MSESEGSSTTSVMDDEDLLWEILLRLPPQPSSLPRASAVCKRWRRMAIDPSFLRSFYAHHRKPPLLGFFEYQRDNIVFTSILDAPDRIPHERFNIGRCITSSEGYVLGCRHGRVLVIDHVCTELIVCTPITGEQRRLAVPPEFKTVLRTSINGAVLCTANDQGHVHGGCHSSPFKVVLVIMYRDNQQSLACVYSSQTNAWGNLISTAAPCRLFIAHRPGSLIGNAFYWLTTRNDMLVFDLVEQSLAVLSGPPVKNCFLHSQIIQVEDGVVGFVVLSYPHFQIWQRKINDHGVATWMEWKTIEMHNILALPPQIVRGAETILGYSEDADVFFIYVDVKFYMVQFRSMQSKIIHEAYYITDYHPFTGFYSPGNFSYSIFLL
ncbi:hypothetical protein CFC21_033856 [Triticum aestivum]|uniref:Uncharacterized protein n=2 Tax=Triticum aestivum TaxID=4565 RepID=A0A3B6EAF7_WHEAT|nr:hypothetical protein CFC21_033856 [Triticum aestivum]